MQVKKAIILLHNYLTTKMVNALIKTFKIYILIVYQVNLKKIKNKSVTRTNYEKKQALKVIKFQGLFTSTRHKTDSDI